MTWKDYSPSPLPFLFHRPPLSDFCDHPPSQYHLLGAGRGRPCSLSVLRLLSFWRAKKVAPPTSHPGSMGRGCSWGQAGGACLEGHASRRAAQGREVAGPALLLDARVPPLPAPPPRAPAWNTTFWTLWARWKASAWTVEAIPEATLVQYCLQLASDLSTSPPLWEQWSPHVS